MRLPFLGKETPAVELYGKLPVAKDYLRVGCAEGAGRELREWLDRTFGALRADGDELELAEPWCFLGQGAKDPLQGFLWPSADAGEQRRFPFTLFVERRAKALAADLEHGGLAQAEAVWRELAGTRERCLDAPDGARLLDGERGRTLSIAGLEGVPGAAADFEAWVGALWPAEGEDGLDALFARLAELARARHAGPLRLPVVRDLPIRDQVVGWTSVLRALGALADDELPTVFFPPQRLVASAAPAWLVAARGPLDDRAVAWLSSAPAGSLGPADLARADDAEIESGAGAPEGAEPLGRALRRALAAHRARSG